MQATVAGYIGQDATINHTATGNVAIGFSVAEKIYNGKETVTQWVKCTVFKQAGKDSISQYLKKGTIVACSGECTINTYQKTDGTVISTLQMVVNNLQLLGGNKPGNDTGINEPVRQQWPAAPQYPLTPQEVYANATAPKDNPPDDLPF